MKIYILRHEDRTNDCSFFSPLTELGLNNANKLVLLLDELNINIIYSSPFIRTLQTIKPYIIKNNKYINIEYGLSEIYHADIIPKKAVGVLLPEYIAKSFNYNCNYKSIINNKDIKYPEKYNDVVIRIKKILHKLIKQHYNSDINILLVTHQSMCCAILEIINKYTKIDNHILYNYPKGRLSLVFDNNWVFKMLN
jgi:2,3-bisphosphoglycerate-dependent phosphoglycerate mutase